MRIVTQNVQNELASLEFIQRSTHRGGDDTEATGGSRENPYASYWLTSAGNIGRQSLYSQTRKDGVDENL